MSERLKDKFRHIPVNGAQIEKKIDDKKFSLLHKCCFESLKILPQNQICSAKIQIEEEKK